MSKRIKMILVVFTVFCIVGGVCLALRPTMDRMSALRRQTELIVSIREGNGSIVVPTTDAIEVDFYDPEPTDTEAVQPITVSFADEALPVEPETVVIGTGILTMDAIDLTLPVADGIRSSDLKVALGHVPDTPAIGEKGNAVVIGHRSYTYGEFLNRLDEVEIGDAIVYWDMDGNPLTFEVYEILTVEPGDLSVFDATAYPSITLLTCAPVRVATHRLIVRGRLVEP